MTNTGLKTNSHLFLITKELRIQKCIREVSHSRSLREFFSLIVSVCIKEYNSSIEELIREIPLKSTLKSIKGRQGVFYVTLGDESYVPWELIMLINSEDSGVYFAYDEETEDSSCLVYDPKYRIYPVEGYSITVEGCGKSFQSFITNTYELDKVFRATYKAKLCTEQSVEEAIEDIKSLLGECSVKLLSIRRI